MPHIDDYSFGKILIDGQEYTSDLIVYPDRVDADWWRKEGHSLCLEDISQALATDPEIFIIGCGKMGVLKVPAETREYIQSQGIEFIEAFTGKACKEYSKSSIQGKTVAAFHLTC